MELILGNRSDAANLRLSLRGCVRNRRHPVNAGNGQIVQLISNLKKWYFNTNL
jgi:hypothetical protein